MRYLFVITLIFCAPFISHAQVKKSTKPKAKVARDGSDITKAIFVNPNDLEDYFEKYNGKWIITELKYSDPDNSGLSLRNSDENTEKLFSMQNDFYDKNDIFNTRIMKINGVQKLKVRILRTAHTNFPNALYGYFIVTGLINDGTLYLAICKRN
jgi:hypothetical protein